MFHPVYFNDYTTFALTSSATARRRRPTGRLLRLGSKAVVSKGPSHRSGARHEVSVGIPDELIGGGAAARAPRPEPWPARPQETQARPDRARRRHRLPGPRGCSRSPRRSGRSTSPTPPRTKNHLSDQIEHRRRRWWMSSASTGEPIGPTWQGEFFLGADGNGRDSMVRLLYGGRNSLLIGFFAALVTTLLRRRRGTPLRVLPRLDRRRHLAHPRHHLGLPRDPPRDRAGHVARLRRPEARADHHRRATASRSRSS